MKAPASAVEAGERSALALGVAVAVAMIAQQLAGKAIRDGFFLSQFSPAALPTAMMIASGLSIVVVLGTSRVFQTVAPAQLVPWVFFGSAAWFVGEWILAQAWPRIAAASLFVHTTSFGAVVVSGFWSVVNERFDPHTAKRVVSRIAGGATAGGVLGGLASWQGAAYLNVSQMILGLGAVNALCGVMMFRFGAGVAGRARENARRARLSVVAIMEETPYLWQLAFLVATSALAAAAFDYVFKARASVAYEGPALVSFFSLFYLGLGVGTFVFQQLFAGRALRWLGLTTTVATMPLAVVVLGSLSIFVGGLASVVLLRGAVAVLESSLYRSGYELLYTPLTPEKKRPTKTMIDVGGDKLGAAVGSGLALMAVQVMPEDAETVLLGLAVLCGGLALYVTTALHSGYVSSLADSLREGKLRGDELDLAEPLTRAAHAEATRFEESPTPRRTAVLPDHRSRGASKEQRFAIPERLEGAVVSRPDEHQAAWSALTAGTEDEVRLVLRWFPQLPHELVPIALNRLSDSQLRAELMRSILRVAPLHVGLFGDVLLSAQRPLAVRRHVPAILQTVGTLRSSSLLTMALTTDRLELRFRAAVALRTLAVRHPELSMDEDLVLDALRDTLAGAEAGRYGPADDGVVLGFAFVALAAIRPPGPLRLALEALTTEDTARRGTGLEYLENILPADLRETLHECLHDPSAARRAAGEEAALLEAARFGESAPESAVDLARWIERLRGET